MDLFLHSSGGQGDLRVLLSWVLLFNLSFALVPLAYADMACEELLVPNTRITYQQLQSMPLSNAKTAAEFLLKHQLEWSPEEKVSRFLSFIETQGLSIFNMRKVLEEIPHVLLNTEFKFYSQSRLQLSYKGSWSTGTIMPSKIKFRHRPWNSIEDVAQDVIAWNYMVSNFLLNNSSRTAENLPRYADDYKVDSRKIFTGAKELTQKLFREKLLEGSGLDIERSVNKLKLIAQNGQNTCAVKNKSDCGLAFRWLWHNLMRFSMATAIAAGTISTGMTIQQMNVDSLDKAATVIQGAMTKEKLLPALKKLGLAFTPATQNDVCEVMIERMQEYQERIQQLKIKSNKTREETIDLNTALILEKGIRESNPQCQ